MRLIRGLPAVADRPVALTVGNFDGVHRGHQAMLARLAEAADDLGLMPAVLTFDPHPREFFSSERAPPRLSSLLGKLEVLRAFGVDLDISLSGDDRAPRCRRNPGMVYGLENLVENAIDAGAPGPGADARSHAP